MKTFKDLKNIVVGEVFYGLMFCVVALVYDRLEYSAWDVSVFWDTVLVMLPVTALIVVTTYIIYHVYAGIKSDIHDIKYRKVVKGGKES